jgi:GTP-binding protein
MFVDKASIRVRAGNGGNGAVSFHREKYVPAGGPDGGDGGRGGDVILQTDPNMSTLMDFRYKRKYTALNGEDGGGKNCSGKDGSRLYIKVPNGTLVRDKESGAIIKDMTGIDEYVIARGGNGGWGNSHFATPTRQAPRFAKSGLPGEDKEVTLELKLLADVGLVGYPNVGKSTLLSVVSKAHPKIADYHFTTLFPNLGVVYAGEGASFVMADIPGIIEGASEGAGLGHDFLRHIDRCRLLIHVVDVSGSEGRDPIEDFKTINEELRQYSPALAERPMLVAANKTDIVTEPEQLDSFRSFIKAQGLELFEISAATQRGVRELVNAAAAKLAHLPPVIVYEPEYVEKEEILSAEDITVTVEDGVWLLEGKWLEKLVSNTNFTDMESMAFFEKQMREAGVYERLESMGISEGDTVSIEGMEFDYAK